MKRKSIALFLMAALAFTAVPALNPVSDTTIVAEAHGGHGSRSSHHGCRDNDRTQVNENGHYHCGDYAAHTHQNGVCPYNTDSRCYDSTEPCYDSCDQEQGYNHC